MSNKSVDTITIRIRERKGDTVTVSGKAFSNDSTRIKMKIISKPTLGVIGFLLESVKLYQYNNEQKKIFVQTSENDLTQGDYRVFVWAR